MNSLPFFAQIKEVGAGDLDFCQHLLLLISATDGGGIIVPRMPPLTNTNYGQKSQKEGVSFRVGQVGCVILELTG